MKKILLLLAVAILFVGGTAFYSMQKTKSLATSSQTAIVSNANIVLSPQIATSSVLVDSATLPVAGYVVIRGIVGSHLSQIIEISPYLEKGEHKNILITYGNENPDNEDLIAMLYADTGDAFFSGNTQPYKDANGRMVAVYVKTGLPVPNSIIEPTVMMDKTMGMNMATVHYTNKGFEPKAITVPVGTMVQFINETNGDMWVASNPHPQHDILPTFDEFESAQKGGTYTYTFDKKGTWGYHDHMHAAVGGIVTVQ